MLEKYNKICKWVSRGSRGIIIIFSGQSLKYKKHRFANYVIINFPKNCCFIKEIGINITDDNKLIIVVNGDEFKKHIFDKEVINFISSSAFKKDLDFLTKNQVEVIFNYTSEYFTDDLIEKFSTYYFYPKKTENQYIFKYYSYDSYLKKVLQENALWFSCPKEFNDPFDCRYSINADPLDYEVQMFYYKEEFKKTQITFDSFIETFKLPSKKEFLNTLETHHFNNSISNNFICCFSEGYNIKLMWSHYADKYKGVCFVFDIKKESSIYSFQGQKVKYRNHLIKKFYDGTPYFEITDVLFSKDSDWSYEREVREWCISDSKEKKGISVPFDPTSLVGVIFGANTTESVKKEIKDLVFSLNKYDVEFINSYIDYSNNSIKLEENSLQLI